MTLVVEETEFARFVRLARRFRTSVMPVDQSLREEFDRELARHEAKLERLKSFFGETPPAFAVSHEVAE